MAPIYNAHDLNARLVAALRAVSPKFKAIGMIFSGGIGQAKTTTACSFPVPEGQQRKVLDFEDSAKFVDSGPTGPDVYLPRQQRFHMDREVMPTLNQVGDVFAQLQAGNPGWGVFVMDNLPLFQDQLKMLTCSGNVKGIQEYFKRFNVAYVLPTPKIIAKWQDTIDAKWWDIIKAIPQQLVLACLRQGIHFVGTTPEGNIWQDYGQPGQKVVGKKMQGLEVWTRYIDLLIFLKRDPNKAGPPLGFINPMQPKSRIPALNPNFPAFDWPHFVAELEAATQRQNEEVPEDARVKVELLTPDPE